MQAAARAMRDLGHGGSAVLIGSINSQMALPGASAYCASKGGVLMLGRALAVDLAPLGIRVNVVGPGVTDTPMSAATLADPERTAAFMARIPIGRPADPVEIARVIAFHRGAAGSRTSVGDRVSQVRAGRSTALRTTPWAPHSRAGPHARRHSRQRASKLQPWISESCCRPIRRCRGCSS